MCYANFVEFEIPAEFILNFFQVSLMIKFKYIAHFLTNFNVLHAVG